MQYLLTEAELFSLKAEGEEARREVEKTLQKLCTLVADNKPVKFWNNKEAKIWGCILTIEGEWYCDQCPVVDECPHEHKRWSK